jgi:hypothetical protein
MLINNGVSFETKQQIHNIQAQPLSVMLQESCSTLDGEFKMQDVFQ